MKKIATMFRKKILPLTVGAIFCCFFQSAVNASSSPVSPVSLLTLEEIGGMTVENLRRFLDEQSSQIINEFTSLIHVVPKDEKDITSVPAFFQMLNKVIKNPAGYFVVKSIILTLQRNEDFTKGIEAEKSCYKTELKDFETLRAAVNKKAKASTAASQTESEANQQPNYSVISKSLKVRLVKLQESLLIRKRIIDFKEHNLEKKFILQVELLSTACEDLLNQANILSKESFMKDPIFKDVGTLSFTNADLVSVTRGVPDVPSVAPISPVPSEFLFFHELLHFSHLIGDPNRCELYKVKDFESLDLIQALKDIPLGETIFQIKDVDLYRKIVAPWKKEGVYVSRSKLFGTEGDTDNEPVIDPEELATIAGSENDNTLFVVSENTYRMFYNLLYNNTYPLRYGHILMGKEEDTLKMTKEMIYSMRIRAVRGAVPCIGFIMSGG